MQRTRLRETVSEDVITYNSVGRVCGIGDWKRIPCRKSNSGSRGLSFCTSSLNESESIAAPAVKVSSFFAEADVEGSPARCHQLQHRFQLAIIRK